MLNFGKKSLYIWIFFVTLFVTHHFTSDQNLPFMQFVFFFVVTSLFNLPPPCSHKGGGRLNQRYAAVNSTRFIYWKKPRIFLVCGSVDAFSHWYLHKIIKLDSISQWILADHTVRFSYQIIDNCQASECFTKNNEKSLTYLCSG